MGDEDLKKLRRDLEGISQRLARAAGETEAILFRDFASQYLAEKLNKSSLRESTKKSFEHQTRKHLIPNFGHLPLHGTFWAVEFDKWVMMTRKENEGNRDPHVRRFFNPKKDLNEILLAAFRAGHIEKQVRLDNPDAKRETGRWLSRNEIAAILRKCGKPFRLMFAALAWTGHRPREVFKWEWDFIKWTAPSDAMINVPSRITKTDRSRTVPLNPRLAYILHIRHHRGNGSRFVFPCQTDPNRPQLTYHSAFGLARAKARVLKCVPYDFRRSVVSTWAKEGKPVTYAANLLDSSPQMLNSIYTKFDPKTLKEMVAPKKRAK